MIRSRKYMKGCIFACLLVLTSLSLAAGKVDLKPLRQLLAKRVEQGQVAGGCIRLVHRGKVIMNEGFGYGDLEKKKPFPSDAHVVIASISKPILATVVWRLQEQGKLDVDKPIDAYLPEFKGLELVSGEKANRAPTTRELMGHTGGMIPYRSKGGKPWFKLKGKNTTLENAVKGYAKQFKLYSQPGTKFAYSGVGTDVVARVAEVASKLPRNELLQRELAKPLGMKNTWYPNSTRKANAVVIRYRRNEDGNLVPYAKPRTPGRNKYSSSGGAIRSTLDDLQTWLMMIRANGKHNGRKYLSRESIKQMLTRPPNSIMGAGGMAIYGPNGTPTTIKHTGSSGTVCSIDYRRDLIVIILTQTRGSDYGSFRKDVEAKIKELVPIPPA